MARRQAGSRSLPRRAGGSMTGAASPGSVLIVDDDRVNRMLLTRSVEREGHRVSAAEDGGTALRLMRQDPPDVVLLDIVMPELNGMSVLERMKGDSILRHVPVIMISAVREMDRGVHRLAMGAE